MQGITEFLPISSSAHLALLPYVVGWTDPGLSFSIVTNSATLLAAMVYFRQDLEQMARHAWAQGEDGKAARRLLAMLACGSVPVVVCGWSLRGWLDTTARLPVVIAAASIGFGLILGWADQRPEGGRGLDALRWRDAWWIGAAQAIALIPGTSRSGATITAALLLGLGRTSAARFSFLLAIPVGVMALVNDLVVHRGVAPRDVGAAMPDAWGLTIGFVVAAISAFATIGWLLRWIAHRRMSIFVVYRVLLGALILFLVWSRSPH